MSRASRKKKRSKTSKVVDSLDTVDSGLTLLDLGPIGIGIAVFGGAIAVVAGVFRFMSRRTGV